MLSKCANPDCPEVFRYLHQGKIFRLSPSPMVLATATGTLASMLTERFWLCDSCSKELTVVWDGTRAGTVPLPVAAEEPAVLTLEIPRKTPQRSAMLAPWNRAVSGSREDW